MLKSIKENDEARGVLWRYCVSFQIIFDEKLKYLSLYQPKEVIVRFFVLKTILCSGNFF